MFTCHLKSAAPGKPSHTANRLFLIPVLLVISHPHAVLDEDERNSWPWGCIILSTSSLRRHTDEGDRGWFPSSFCSQIGTVCLQTVQWRRQNSFPSFCAFYGRDTRTASCCMGMLAQLSCGLAFKPNQAHWV